MYGLTQSTKRNNSNISIAILGAGPGGLAAANTLAKKGFRVTLFEASNKTGGLARSFELWGQQIELGPHFLSSNCADSVRKLLFTEVENDIQYYKRNTSALINNKTYNYPPSPSQIIKKLSPSEFISMTQSLLIGVFKSSKSKLHLEAKLQRSIGDYLYQQFFADYLYKLWGRSGKEIGAGYADGILGTRKLSTIIKKISGLKRKSKSKLPGYINPILGMSHLWDKLSKDCVQLGVDIKFNNPVENIRFTRAAMPVEIRARGKTSYFHHVISTLPAGLMTSLIKTPATIKASAQKIEFRSIVLVYLKVNADEWMNQQALFLYGKDIKSSRLSDFNNFNKNLSSNKERIVLLEYWCDKNDTLFNKDTDELKKLAIFDLQKTEKYKGIEFLDSHIVRIPRGFPVFDLQYQNRVGLLKNWFEAIPELTMAGRTLSLQVNMGAQKAMNLSIKAAEKIAEKYSAKIEPFSLNDKLGVKVARA